MLFIDSFTTFSSGGHSSKPLVYQVLLYQCGVLTVLTPILFACLGTIGGVIIC